MELSKSERYIKALEALDIKEDVDILYHLPRSYADFSLTPLNNLENKSRIVMQGKLVSNPVFSRGRKVNNITFSFVSLDAHFFSVIAYNRPYLLKSLNFNDIYTLVGTYESAKHMVNLISIVKGEMKENLKPIYSLPHELENHAFINMVDKAIKNSGKYIDNVVPRFLIEKYHLEDKLNALKLVHQPKVMDDVKKGLRTLKYEECLLFSLQTQLIREQNKIFVESKENKIPLKKINDFILSLPYKLTKDQVNAVKEIILDMDGSKLMYRLLQGDVGTGKTLVASIAMYGAFLRGDQSVIMAPTDALAKQHYETLISLFKGQLRIGLLVGGLNPLKRLEVLKKAKNHELDIIVGTHALFSKDVEYARLGLAIIDEQHKFGVNQRTTLAKKGESTDILLMSATPIPRTLSMTLYGDLDITTLRMFPFSKRNVITKIVKSDSPLIKELIDENLKLDKHIFIVAPLISYQEERFSVENLYIALRKDYKDKIAVLHGHLDSEQKDEVLKDFYSKKKPILISTSVIEVGIDVKDASLMIIYDASGFGLSSIHQLRGRIGRDGNVATCLLVNDEDNDKLDVLSKTEDGFVIAEEDLKMRGPGELNGLKQSGLPTFKYINIIEDIKIFEAAREDAKEILSKDKKHVSPIVRLALSLTLDKQDSN